MEGDCNMFAEKGRKMSMFLIKYSEIGVKGGNRHIFEDILVRNIKNVLRRLDVSYKVWKSHERVYVKTEEDRESDVMSALLNVFGIAEICPVTQYERNAQGKSVGIEEIKSYAVSFMKDTYKDAPAFTFKVRTRRADKSFPLTSMEVSACVGESLLEAFPSLSVDVRAPEVMLEIEIRGSEVNFYSKEYKGPGGLPVGSGTKAMLLLSGGIDSPVAGYMMAKRGVSVDAVYFHAPPYTSERAKQKVVDLAKIISKYTGGINLHIVNFTEIQMKIYELCPHEELTIIMRRYMMKIAERLAKDSGCLGLCTGESIGQVASQTMQSMLVTNEVCGLPVYRPLCCFDKLDTTDLAQKIGTYETSILPYEDCCTIFVAKHPETKPNLERIKRSEERLSAISDEMLKRALESEEVITVDF